MLNKKIICALPLALGLTACGNDDVTPMPVDYQQPAAPLLAGAANSALYKGVAQITGLGSHCSGFVIDHGVAEAPAYMLTNGHCVGLFGNQEMIFGEAANGLARFGLFVDQPSNSIKVAIDQISWASMRGTDLAVVRTNQTLAELAAQGIPAYRLTKLPAVDSQVQVVGVPVQNLPSDQWLLRGTSCKAGQQRRVLEFVWLWDNAQATDCAGILAGNSGSPVFDSLNRVTGIINTTTIGAEIGGDCYLGKPCEVSDDNVTARPNTSYWLAVDAVAGCFDNSGSFNHTLPQCKLEQPQAFYAQNNLRVSRSPASWRVNLDGPASISLKIGPLTTTDCREPAGYQGTWYSGERYQADLPADAKGHWILCATGYGTDGQLQTQSAGFTTLEIDNTPPARVMHLNTMFSDDSVVYAPRFSPPELSSYRWKSGPAASTDCTDTTGYQIFRRIPRRAELNELPLTVCLIGSDEAGNETPVLAVPINKP